jgi:hypothetical protein
MPRQACGIWLDPPQECAWSWACTVSQYTQFRRKVLPKRAMQPSRTPRLEEGASGVCWRWTASSASLSVDQSPQVPPFSERRGRYRPIPLQYLHQQGYMLTEIHRSTWMILIQSCHEPKPILLSVPITTCHRQSPWGVLLTS